MSEVHKYSDIILIILFRITASVQMLEVSISSAQNLLNTEKIDNVNIEPSKHYCYSNESKKTFK